ncbi:uncharacterized protein DEA37_0005696, partial [Paragonimus westermani]
CLRQLQTSSNVCHIGCRAVLSLFQKFFEVTATVWKDAGVQEAYERSNEYQLIDCAKYFLDRALDVGKSDYQPTEQVKVFSA